VLVLSSSFLMNVPYSSVYWTQRSVSSAAMDSPGLKSRQGFRILSEIHVDGL
jgi:hypothetical protein